MAMFKAAAMQMRSGTDVEAATPATFEQMVRDGGRRRRPLCPDAGDDRRAGARQGGARRGIPAGRGATSSRPRRPPWRPSSASTCMLARRHRAAPTASSPTARCLYRPAGRWPPPTTRSTCSTSISTMAKAGANRRPMSPARRRVVAELPIARLGFAICYDVRFPQLFRAEALAGAEVLTAPAAFTRQTGEAHWHVLAAGPRDRERRLDDRRRARRRA